MRQRDVCGKVMMTRFEVLKMVPGEGLEPPCREALDPKSSVSANSTSRACYRNRAGSARFHKFIFYR